ncbi:MAG TPA: GDSL-type esterase/lipase family protein [Polyangiaceae bacterium]|nr:GDSL-type esterase/lipase family protein [Polyangiaceae bacterium]
MKTPRFAWLLLFAGLVGCAGAQPDEAPESGTAGQPPTVPSAGSGAGLAGSTAGGSTGVGGQPNSAGSAAGGGSATAGSGAGGQATGGTASASAGAAGAPNTAGSAGTAAGGAAGSSSVDPSTLPETTLHLAGDSTVMTYAAGSAQEGWGQELPPFLLTKVKLNNQAIGGASVETFYTGRWKNIISALKAGDYVMAAFGANDSGSVEGRHVDPPAFQARYGVMAQEVKAKQATFIVVTPSALQEWSGGKNGNARLGPYATVLREFATTQSLTLVDLNARSLELLNQVGQEAAKLIYIGGDKAHFTKQGATQMAELLAKDLKRTTSPLAAYVK